jgi:hypothetical protein
LRPSGEGPDVWLVQRRKVSRACARPFRRYRATGSAADWVGAVRIPRVG